MERLKRWARRLKKQVVIVYLASKDGRVPWYTKVLAILVAAYAFSPIDLIPDFIPILGYLDDVLIVPIGVWIVLKMIPEHVLIDLKGKAEKMLIGGKPRNYIAGAVIVLTWIALSIGMVVLIVEYWNR